MVCHSGETSDKDQIFLLFFIFFKATTIVIQFYFFVVLSSEIFIVFRLFAFWSIQFPFPFVAHLISICTKKAELGEQNEVIRHRVDIVAVCARSLR